MLDKMLTNCLDSLIEREKEQGIRDDLIYIHAKRYVSNAEGDKERGQAVTNNFDAYIDYVCKKIPY